MAPPMNASVIRNSGEASSTPISEEELKNVRTIVLTNTRTTSTTSATLSSTMMARSSRSIHAGTGCGRCAESRSYMGTASVAALDGIKLPLDLLRQSDVAGQTGALPRRVDARLVLIPGGWGTLAVGNDSEKLFFFAHNDRQGLSSVSRRMSP